MTDIWTTAKLLLLLAGMAIGVVWGAALLHGYFDGSVSGIRAGLKLVMITGLMIWLYDRWTLLRDA